MDIRLVDNEIRIYADNATPQKYDRVSGKWECYYVVANKTNPIRVIVTNNRNDRVIAENANTISRLFGGKCLKQWTRGNYIDDPYGRPYGVGTINCSVWDFREVFGLSNMPIEKYLGYEILEFVMGRSNCIYY